MADLFISYSRHDRDRIERLAAMLERAGWSVWWDRRIHAGNSFDKVIETAIDEAKAVIAAWSESAVASDWVRAEAAYALETGKLIPVRLDAATPPLRFRHVQTIDLSNWKGGEGEEAARALIADIAAMLGAPGSAAGPVSPAPVPTPRPATSTRARWIAVAAASVVGLALAGGGAFMLRSGVTALAPQATPSAFDGTWRGPMTCSGTKNGFPGFTTDNRPFKVVGGRLSARIDVPALGAIDHETYEGRIEPDGTAEIAGHGENTRYGPYGIHFTGKVESGTLTLAGAFRTRDCTLVYRRQ